MDLSKRIKAIFSTGDAEGTAAAPAKPVVLIVEDDDIVRWMLIRALEARFNVVEASDGKAALEILGKMRTPDAIVCDMMMPKIDGLSLVRALKADSRLAQVPVLFLTARDTAL